MLSGIVLDNLSTYYVYLQNNKAIFVDFFYDKLQPMFLMFIDIFKCCTLINVNIFSMSVPIN